MIKGVGTDIVDIDRIVKSLEDHGDKFAERILSEAELAVYKKSNLPAQFLASRFAVKEAVAKAFGTGFRDGLYMRDITVCSDGLGKPCLEFSGQAQCMAEKLGVQQSHLSIAHERHTAIAFVVLT